MQSPLLPANRFLLTVIPAAIAILLPVIELATALSLYIDAYRKYGLYAALILMILFTGYLAGVLAFVPDSRIPCTCGGVWRYMSWEMHLQINVVLTLLAITGVAIHRAYK